MKTYQIIITDQTKTARRTTAAYSSGEVENKKSTPKTSTDDKTLSSIMLAAYHYAKRGLNLVGSYVVDTVELRMGNVKAQQNADFAYQCLTDVYNLGESVVLGKAAGGWTGAAVGLAVSAVSKVASVGIAYGKIGLARSVENVTIAQNTIRISYGGERMGSVK